MEKLKNLTKVYEIFRKGKLILMSMDNIFDISPIKKLEEIFGGTIMYTKDPNQIISSIDPVAGRIFVPKTIGAELIGKVPKNATHYQIEKRESISKKESKSKIIYYQVKN